MSMYESSAIRRANAKMEKDSKKIDNSNTNDKSKEETEEEQVDDPYGWEGWGPEYSSPPR